MAMHISDPMMKKLHAFCTKWKVQELALFGSAVRADFDPQKSDVDVLYVFQPDAPWGWELVDIRDELAHILGRSVDLVSKHAIERSRNPYKRAAILKAYKIIYEKTS